MSSSKAGVSAPLAEEEDFDFDWAPSTSTESAGKDVSSDTSIDDGRTSPPCDNTDRESAVDTNTDVVSDALSHPLDRCDPSSADAHEDPDPLDWTAKMNGESVDEGSANREPMDSVKQGATDCTESKDDECVDSTTGIVHQGPEDDSTEKTNRGSTELNDDVKQDSAVWTETKNEESDEATSADRQDLDSDSADKMDRGSTDPCDVEEEESPDTTDKANDDEVTEMKDELVDFTDKAICESSLGVSGELLEECGSTQSSQSAEVTLDTGGGGAESADDPLSALTSTDAAQQSAPTLHTALPHQHDDALPSLGETTTQGETTQAGSGEATDELQISMDAQGETNAGSGRMNDVLDDFFGTRGGSDPALRINGLSESGGAGSTSRFDREKSPEIVVDSIDGVENVTLKDATTEKALLGNGDVDGSSLRTDSLGSKTDEEKRKSSSDMDMDFAVLELDSSHLNLDLSKQKTSLRKRGSLARRKKPTRGSGNNIIPGTEDSIFQDSTVAKPVTSPTSDTAEDDVFDTAQQTAAPQPAVPNEMPGVRKSAQPYKPPIVMPGLQDLSKSKLFSQERNKSGETESPTSPIKSPLRSPASPANRGAPPTVLPKPTSKGQKDWQNKTIAAVTSSHNGDSTTSTTASALDELWSSGRSDADNTNPTQSDPKMGRKDSWSSVSSPRRLSRGDSMDGGDGALPSTPRRASIQGSAYAPIGFRPRRSSSIVLDANNKLIDNPQVPSSPGPSSASPTLEEEGGGARSPPPAATSAVKSPLYKAPVWLSEMKAKTGNAPGDSTHARTSSSGSMEESATSIASSRDRSESAGSTDGSTTDGGVRARSISDEVNLKKREEHEAEKPSWMKAAQEKTSRMADQLNNKKEEENSEELDDDHPKPHWVTGLRKTNRPLVPPTDNTGVVVTPYKNSGTNDKENQPVANDGRDQYAPSWMKRGQVKKPPVPLPGAAGKGASTNGSGTSENPMKAYETPRWKLELAEKRKRREAEMQSVGEESCEDSMPSGAPSGGSPPSNQPQWKKQLSQRKKRSIPGTNTEGDADAGGDGPEWARKAEERRQRIIQSGLLEKAAKANGADES